MTGRLHFSAPEIQLDPDEARARQARLQSVAKIEPLSAHGGFRAVWRHLHLHGASLQMSEATAYRIMVRDDPTPTFVFAMRGAVTVRSRTTEQTSHGEVLALPPGARTTIVSPSHHGMAIRLPLASLDAREARALYRLPTVLPKAASDQIRGLLAMVVAQGATPDIGMRLRETLLLLADHRPARSAGQPAALRAVDFIRAYAGEPLTLTGIAKAVGTTPRSLQEALKRAGLGSVRTMLLTARLEAAQEALRSAAPGDTVTSIAARCGITQPGRFAVRYRRLFGESPSATLARALGR